MMYLLAQCIYERLSYNILMMPDPRINTGYQPQQTMPQQTMFQQTNPQQTIPQHMQQQQNPYMNYRKRWDDSHVNKKAVWLAIGPTVLYCMGTILFAMLMALLSDGSGDVGDLFAMILYSFVLFIWLFTSVMVAIVSTIVAFIKKCPKIWMIFGPGIGFVISLISFMMIVSIFVDGVGLDDIMDDFFDDVSGISMLFVGFISHTAVSFGTMMLMVLGSNDEQF